MTRSGSWKREGVVVACAIAALVLVLAAAGCSGERKGGGSQAPRGATAKEGVAAARSALSTTAPDAKLLLVQTAQPVTSTAAPVWAYLFGDPASDKTYVVYVADGRAMGASEYGLAGLDKSEWASVPATNAWEVDSDDAYARAVEAGKVKEPDTYQMGMVMYVPRSQAQTSTTDVLTWYVSLQSDTATAAVQVDGKTGKATVNK